jgi:hypothetical protein
MLDRNYLEENVRFTVSGKEVRFKLKPAKMSAQGLAKVIVYKMVQRPEVFKSFFMERINGIITDFLGSQQTGSTRPTRVETANFRAEVEIKSRIIFNNLDKILKDALKRESENPDMQYLGRMQKKERTREEMKQHDEAVFNLRLQRSITGLLMHPGFSAVVADYKLVQEVLKDQRRFPELEKLANSALRKFMTTQRIRYMDEESQRQEGLLAIWVAAQKYEGRNLARFSTLAKVALQNKFCNLIEYFTAHKRRVQKYTSPMGSATDPKESFLARKIEKLAAESWRRVQRIQLSDQAREDAEYDPFFSLPFLGDYSECTSPREEWEVVFEKDTVVVDDKNFPHLNEGKVERVRHYQIYDRKKFRAQEEFIEKWQRGDCYVDADGILRVNNPSALLQEIERGEDFDEGFKDRKTGNYRDPPPIRRAKNLQQLDKLVEFGEDLTFEDMVEALEKGGWTFSFGKSDPEWEKTRDDLIQTVNREYTGAIVGEYPLRLGRGDIANQIIPRHIKAKYVRCFILSESAAGTELYNQVREIKTVKEANELPF